MKTIFSYSHLAIACSMSLIITGCATVSVGKRSTAESIMAQRVTVLTGNQLSEDTKTRLLQAGLDEPTCLANMPACLVALQQSSFTPTDKGLYGAYSELFYAAALQQKSSPACSSKQTLSTDFAKNLLASPSSIPNSATMTTSSSTQPSSITTVAGKPPNDQIDAKVSTPKKIGCQDVYKDNLLQASRFAYIYLMYDTLLKNNPKSLNNADDPSILSQISALHNTPDGINNAHSVSKSLANNPTTPLKLPTVISELPKERDIQIQDLYYAATDDLSQLLYIRPLKSDYQVNDSHIAVTYNGKPPTPDLAIERLVSTYQLNLSGLNSISRRDGLGMNYVAIHNDRYTTSIRNQLLHRNGNRLLTEEERIHPLGHSPVTLFMLPVANNLNEALSTNEFSAQIYDPYQTKTVSLLGNEYALSANFSAPYALWLKDNALQPVSLLNLLAKNRQQTQPHLFMLEEYDPNKRVIIMLHGLASSPETWIQLTNDIFNDPTLRDNYQVWQVFYPTNIPMLENRYQIQNLLQTAFDKADPTHQDNASHHAVLIGHSMGGIIGRMMLSDDNLTPKVQQMLANYSRDTNTPYRYRSMLKALDEKQLESRFDLHPLPQVDRAVFISAPFQGTNYADKWFTRAIRRIIQLPSGFVQTVSQNLSSVITNGELSQNPLGSLFLENGASQLSDQSFFIQLTKDVHIDNGVTVHSIIASQDKDIIDGITQQIKDSQLKSEHPNDPQISDSEQTDAMAKIAIPTTPSQNADIIAQTHTQTQSKIPMDDPAQMLYNAQNLDNAIANAKLTSQVSQQVAAQFANKISDGIVPYRSAHLDNVASEKVLQGNHSVHTSPQAVLELRRILHLQLQKFSQPNPDPKDNQP